MTVPNRDVPHYVWQRRDFLANSMQGTHSFQGFGRLNPTTSIPYDMPGVYWVYSYATPIAWCHNGEWTVVTIPFSPTTSRHQGLVRQAIKADREGFEPPLPEPEHLAMFSLRGKR